MKIKERFIEIWRIFWGIILKYWWVIILIGIGIYYFTDLPILKYLKYIFLIIAIIIGLLIFVPFLLEIFSPVFVLIAALIDHFKSSKRIPFGKKWFFIPAALLGFTSFLLANTILWVWIWILGIIAWSLLIGFVGILLSIIFPHFAVFTAPFVFWYKEGFPAFVIMGILLLMTLFWFGFSKLAFSEDFSLTPEDFLGYSPQIFLLGSLSFQVIALPFYHFELFIVGWILSTLIGLAFLLLALISAFKWRSMKKKLSKEEREHLYKPSVWIYILGFFFTNIIFMAFERFEAPHGVLTVLNTYFLVALIGRFFGLFRRKPKIQEIEYESEQE